MLYLFFVSIWQPESTAFFHQTSWIHVSSLFIRLNRYRYNILHKQHYWRRTHSHTYSAHTQKEHNMYADTIIKIHPFLNAFLYFHLCKIPGFKYTFWFRVSLNDRWNNNGSSLSKKVIFLYETVTKAHKKIYDLYGRVFYKYQELYRHQEDKNCLNGMISGLWTSE